VREEVLTARLRLRRPVVGEDEERYRRLFADPVVRAWLWPPPLEPPGPTEGDAALARDVARWAGDGFGPWLAFGREDGELVGRVGLARAELAGEAVVEVGWAVLGPHQGAGLATEAALAAVDAARELGLPEVVAFTLDENIASRRVMERAGFVLDGTVEHAGLPHVVYRRAP
jgi:RimJ/RimL family protein N-acetyltransferase